jgi:hypothetical protein
VSAAVDDGDGGPTIKPDTRTVTALTRTLAVTEEAPGLYLVQRVDDDGQLHAHDVDIHEGRCTCEDHRYRGVDCYHIRRVAFETGQAPLPDWIDSPERLAPFFRARWRRGD